MDRKELCVEGLFYGTGTVLAILIIVTDPESRIQQALRKTLENGWNSFDSRLKVGRKVTLKVLSSEMDLAESGINQKVVIKGRGTKFYWKSIESHLRVAWKKRRKIHVKVNCKSLESQLKVTRWKWPLFEYPWSHLNI